MGQSDLAVELKHRTVDQEDSDCDSIPPAVILKHLGQFGSTQFESITVSFGSHTNSRRSFLPVVYARRSKQFHTGKWKKTAVNSLLLGKENTENTKLLC